jgi:cytochrome c-type biogenesis protein CcmH
VNKNTLKNLVSPLLLMLVLALVLAGPAAAQEPEPRPVTDDQVNAIAKQLYCPVCENIPLDVCPTQACEQWRGLIREKLAAGWNENQIKQYFVDQYGPRVIGTPPARGLSLLVYIIPPLAILAGATILYRALRAWRQPAARPAAGPAAASGLPDENPPAPADPYLARLEEELRKR